MSFLTYPATDRQKELMALASGLADIFAERASRYDLEGRFPLENYTDLRESGYLTVSLPRELGGWGMRLEDIMHAQYRLAQGDASTALVTAMHFVHTARLVDGRSNYPELVLRICRDIVQNGAIINAAVSEPVTGSPSRGGRPETTAYRQKDGSWRIQGRKTFTTGSYALSYFVVGCSIEDASTDGGNLEPLKATKGQFLVPHDARGVSIEDTWHTLGMRGTGSNDLLLDDVHVDADAYMDEQVPLVEDAALRMAAWGALTAAVYLGIGQAARDEAFRFARSRHPNSLREPIASLPHIQDKAGRIELALLQSQALLFSASEQFSRDATSVSPSIFAAAKYTATNHALEIVDLAMRIVGAASLDLSSPLQRYYRDVRAGLHNPPMDDAVITMLAQQALKKPEGSEEV
jgi:alkylation response protein AidB-like acyl-CoA dehydrogenase